MWSISCQQCVVLFPNWLLWTTYTHIHTDLVQCEVCGSWAHFDCVVNSLGLDSALRADLKQDKLAVCLFVFMFVLVSE